MTRRNVAGIASGETLYPAPKQLILHPDKCCDQLCVEDAAWRRRTRLRYPGKKSGGGGVTEFRQLYSRVTQSSRRSSEI